MNNSGIRIGGWVRVFSGTRDGSEVVFAVPTVSRFANARIVNVHGDGSFYVHWTANYNLDGHFRTELMAFSPEGILDTQHLEARNAVRRANGLFEVRH